MKYRLSIAMFCMAALLNGCGGGSSGSTPTPTPSNVAPIANPGQNQSVVIGTAITLDASASSDANSDPLTYLWTLTTKPAGSAAVLSSTSVVKPTFTADVVGTYNLTLVVNDGKLNSTAASVAVVAAVANAAPVANAGLTQNVTTTSTVTLDGSLSSDANNDVVNFLWVLKNKPANSVAKLEGATTVKPTFIADLAGTYQVSLVVNDGKVNSAEVTVDIVATVVAANAAPMAKAGLPQNVIVGSAVKLSGKDSSDPNGDPLTYKWTMTSKPTDSAVTLTNSNVVDITFTADKPGTFVATLVVNDGKLDSEASTVSITATARADNATPVAKAGAAQSVVVGDTVQLNAKDSSDADGDALTYQWTIKSLPIGSDAAINSPTEIAPKFVADKPGDYLLSLVVSDFQASSVPATVIVTAFAKLNDTGITANQCQDRPDSILMSCTSAAAIAYYDQQDGMVGRDVTSPEASDGKLGFKYTKLDATGKVLPASATTWSCVKDNTTGLTWEVKTADGGQRDRTKSYTNYGDGRTDDASAFAKSVNSAGLCGYYSEWRLPTAMELQSIVDYGTADATFLDSAWFVNTLGTKYWTSTRRAFIGEKTNAVDNAWFVDFSNGEVSPYINGDSKLLVRLVR
nr:PKD domain-containing protein [uncultured Undibacterium sp.]